MSKLVSWRCVYLFRMVLGVLIILLAVVEVLASQLLSQLPLLRIVAGLGILWLLSTFRIHRMDSEHLLRSEQELKEADAALYRLRRFDEKVLSNVELGVLIVALLFMIVRQRLG